jgi:ketol-acid reductoisomerase
VGKKVAVIGYGNMGQPLALNLRDSGVESWRAPAPTDKDQTRQKALQDGFEAYSISDAVKATHIALMTIPDEVMPAVYLEHVAPYLQRNDALVFVSAYNVAFGYIEAPPFVDVGLIAPRTLGDYARKRYLTGKGFYSFVSVGQDASGNCWDIVLALAGALGSLKAGAIEINFEREAELEPVH